MLMRACVGHAESCGGRRNGGQPMSDRKADEFN